MKTTTLSAGVVPVRKVGNGWEFLILRAFNYWDFPKGMVETGEDPWDAAVRELQEETGISNFTTPYGRTYTETEPYGKGKTARYYILEICETRPIELKPNPITGVIEHHEYRWLPYEGAHYLMVPRVKNVLDWAQKQLHS